MKSQDKSRFTAYINRRTEHNEKLLTVALRTLDPQKHDDITSYCKALSLIISELRLAKSSDGGSPYHGRQVRSQSYTTLLRNPSYRKLIEAKFFQDAHLPTAPMNEDIEYLHLEITRLQAENNLLTNKVLRLDSKSPHQGIEYNDSTETQRLQRQIHVLLKAYKGVRISSRGVVDERYEDNLNSNLLGLYGIYGLILTPSELKEIESAQRELPEDLKANLTKSLSLLR